MDALTQKMPVAVRLPLIAATMIFFTAVVSTQTAIIFMSRQAERQVATLGHVYLDGLSAALLTPALNGDAPAIQSVLERALKFHEGVVDRRLVYFDTERAVVADAQRDELPETGPPPAIGPEESGALPVSPEGDVWIWRGLHDGDTQLGIVAANLDISSFQEQPRQLRLYLLLFDLAFSFACAVIGFFMVRRMQQPLALLARRLYDAAFGEPRPIGDDEMPRGDRQASRMFHAFNAMAHASHEREALLSHLADQEREAVLGRLAATIAHEVRNPLGGMRTAVGTLKRYGDRPETRNEAVDFLERGVRALEEVVNATLESHRARPQWRALSRQDFHDLRLLVEADGSSRGVTIDMELDIPDEMHVAALEVRQILLNLLLNAVHASAKGETVKLTAKAHARELVIEVQDRGSGLDAQTARALEEGSDPQDLTGLGVAVVIRLVERLQGRVSVQAKTGSGTRITLSLPFRANEAAK